jgi:hypothetical protein
MFLLWCGVIWVTRWFVRGVETEHFFFADQELVNLKSQVDHKYSYITYTRILHIYIYIYIYISYVAVGLGPCPPARLLMPSFFLCPLCPPVVLCR